MNWLRNCVGGLLLTLLTPSVSHAMEPGNDTASFKWFNGSGDVTTYNSNQPSQWTWWWFESIASSSDVDHVPLACNGRTVLSAGIELKHANGDLDIYVYDIAGNLLGSSAGVSNSEQVDVRAFGKQQVILKVYGYNGATGGFSPQVTCS